MINQEIELMLDPLEIENTWKRPIKCDLFDEIGQEIWTAYKLNNI